MSNGRLEGNDNENGDYSVASWIGMEKKKENVSFLFLFFIEVTFSQTSGMAFKKKHMTQKHLK